MTLSSRTGRWITLIVLALIAAATILPLMWTLNMAMVTPEARLLERFPLALPPDLTTLADVWRHARLPGTLINSVILSAGAVIALWIMGSMAGFALSMMRFRGRTLLLLLLLAFVMVPVEAILFPLFAVVKQLGWLNQYHGLIAVFAAFGLPLTTFLFASYFRGLPMELVEAAKIDGAGTLRVLVSVVLPLSRPVLATSAIINGLWTWNALLLPLLLITRPERQTLVVTLATLRGEFAVDPVTLSATAVVGVTPTLLIYLVAQRYIISGVVAGAVK